MEKKCKICGEEDEIMFYKSQKGACKKCMIKRQIKRYNEKKPELAKYQLDYYDKNLIKVRWLAARHRAIKKNLEFTITPEFLVKLLKDQKNKCPYTKKEFINCRDKLYSWSIDKIDATGGYTEDNVELVSSIVNDAKKQLSKKEFVDLIHLIAKNTK